MAENLGIGVNHGKKVIVTKDGKKYEKAGLGNSAAAVGMGLGAYTISKVRDAIAHPKEIKSNN